MNYKRNTLLLFIILAGFFANGQTVQHVKKIPSWKISYNLDFSTEQPTDTASKGDQEQLLLMEMAKALSGSSDSTPPLICYVNHDFIRVEQKGLGGGVTLADKRKPISYLLDSLDKIATEYPLEMPNLQTQLAGDSMAVISSADFSMELKKDTMTIAGKHCRKAIFTNPDSPKNMITIWYAPAMPRLYWQKYSYLKQVPGCVLSISTLTKGMHVGIKASLVEQMNLPESFFRIPADYKIDVGLSY